MPTGMRLDLMRLTLILRLAAVLAVVTNVRPVVGRRHVLVDPSLGLEPERTAFALVRGLSVARRSAVLVSGIPARLEGSAARSAAEVISAAGSSHRHFVQEPFVACCLAVLVSGLLTRAESLSAGSAGGSRCRHLAREGDGWGGEVDGGRE